MNLLQRKPKCRQVKVDWDSDSEDYDLSDNSDFEDGIPLKELMVQSKSNDFLASPISSRT